MKVVYLGATWRGSNAQSFRKAFESLGHDVVAVDIHAPFDFYGRSLAWRVVARLNRGPLARHKAAVRDAAMAAVRAARPRLIFLTKALCFDGTFIEDMRRESGAILVHWHPDDSQNLTNSSPEFRSAIPVYDVCVTPKSYNVPELRADGARRVEFLPYAYDPDVHHPVDPRPGAPVDASFVGGWEPERAAFLERAAIAGVDLEVWGAYWHRLSRTSPLRPHCRYREVFAEEMARVFVSSRLTLGFLRKVNRDRHTARTFEIPASGGVMLTERTDEQRMFFEEGKEALYFDTPDEMVATIRDYARRPADLERIRSAALARCVRGGYSYAERLEDLLSRLGFVRSATL